MAVVVLQLIVLMNKYIYNYNIYITLYIINTFIIFLLNFMHKLLQCYNKSWTSYKIIIQLKRCDINRLETELVNTNSIKYFVIYKKNVVEEM